MDPTLRLHIGSARGRPQSARSWNNLKVREWSERGTTASQGGDRPVRQSPCQPLNDPCFARLGHTPREGVEERCNTVGSPKVECQQVRRLQRERGEAKAQSISRVRAIASP